MSAALIRSEFAGSLVSFTEEGWFNATRAAERYGKRVDHWLENQETKEYITALCEVSNTRKEGYLKTRRGNNGGTWLHPDLAVAFARWLDVRFGVWCDRQIRAILTGDHPHFDWARVRHEATASHKLLAEMVHLTSIRQGKASDQRHYINEAKLIGFALTGRFDPIDRDNLSRPELDLLAKLETLDAALLGAGMDYEERKEKLLACVEEGRRAPALPSEAAAGSSQGAGEEGGGGDG